MKIGKFKTKTTCRICGTSSFKLVIDMGFMPHAGDFLTKKEIGKELYYPLKIWQCKKCGLVQILDVIPPRVLFRNYHYLSSVTLTKHFTEYAKEMYRKYLRDKSFVVDIGSNDGVLLYPLKKMGVKVLGVDASKSVADVAAKKGIETMVGEFGKSIAEKIVKTSGKVDAIFANNVLAHIDDVKTVFRGIKILLKEDGVLVIELHYLPDLIKKLQYDFFYNEHLTYYTLTTLSRLMKRFGIVPFDVKKIPIHSGSIRVYAKFIGNRKHGKTNRLKRFLNKEKDVNRLLAKNILNFSRKVECHKKVFLNKINNIKSGDIKIVGYGASGRANTLLNYCKLGKKQIDYIVDESPERYGKFTPGTHIPIINPEFFRKDKNAKYVLLLAWNYKEEIINKEQKYINKGGKFIVPFPKVSIFP